MIPFKPSEGGKPAAKREKQSQREGDDPQTKPSEEVTEPEAKPHIPEYFEFNKEEALNLSSEGRISFDTKKFKNSEYFLKMMDKISGYWNNALPRMANYLGLIPSGDIEMLLMLDRDGNLLDYKIVKHFDYSSMINATIYAVTHATPFGKIPDDISGPTIIIPVTFKYISTR